MSCRHDADGISPRRRRLLRRFSLSDVADAHAAIEDRSAQGKIVVDIG